MTTRKVTNPNQKSGAGFIWTILAIILIAAVVIGLIFFNGRTKRDEALSEKMIPVDNLSIEYTEGDPAIVLNSKNGAANAVTVDLFEDFSCPHCADLATASDEEMLQKIEAGELSVNLRPMTILDRQGTETTEGHSTRALAAELALAAHDDVPAMWNLRAHLLENQKDVYNRFKNDDFADLARGFGASEEAISDIRAGKFIEAAKEMGQQNVDYQSEKTGEAYTPRVFKDGEDVRIPSQDPSSWIDDVLS
ncbi:thioredoxin domain-containing protein [Corynebacterium mayonis]|uniref:thioredoxin domain-containing protein n=1 Tax=Corynebacterium mayonis TaxID=3062461 RepID=UPI0031401088